MKIDGFFNHSDVATTGKKKKLSPVDVLDAEWMSEHAHQVRTTARTTARTHTDTAHTARTRTNGWVAGE